MGIVSSILNEGFPPKSKFAVEDILDLTGKVIIVTGANTGIGKETAKALLIHNARVYIAARSKEKTESAIKDLREQTGKEAFFLKLDLADLKAVRAAAEEFLSMEKELHVLYNNGGVMVPPIDQLTQQGYDLQFGTNVLGHFYFTKLLLPVLLSTVKSSPDKKVRVVTVASSGHLFHGLDFNTFKEGPARKKLGVQMLYAQSKHGNVVFAAELARRFGERGIVSAAVNPGNIRTDLQRELPKIQDTILGFFLYPAEMGALTQLWAGTSAEGANSNGKYIIPWARVGAASRESQDPEIGKQLWTWMEEQVENI